MGQVGEGHGAAQDTAGLDPGADGETDRVIGLLPTAQDRGSRRWLWKTVGVEVLAVKEPAVHGIGRSAKQLPLSEVIIAPEDAAVLVLGSTAGGVGEEPPGRRRFGHQKRREYLLLGADADSRTVDRPDDDPAAGGDVPALGAIGSIRDHVTEKPVGRRRLLPRRQRENALLVCQFSRRGIVGASADDCREDVDDLSRVGNPVLGGGGEHVKPDEDQVACRERPR